MTAKAVNGIPASPLVEGPLVGSRSPERCLRRLRGRTRAAVARSSPSRVTPPGARDPCARP